MRLVPPVLSKVSLSPTGRRDRVTSFFFFSILPTVLSQLDFSHGNLGCFFWGKSAATVALPNLSYMPGCVRVSTIHKNSNMDHRIFNVRRDVYACDCTLRVHGRRVGLCTESGLWKKNPLPHQGIEYKCQWHASWTLPTWVTSTSPKYQFCLPIFFLTDPSYPWPLCSIVPWVMQACNFPAQFTFSWAISQRMGVAMIGLGW